MVVFFFQAEGGIRDYDVTGVQTCALPILAVEDQQQCAEAHDEPVKAAEARVIDDFVNIYFSHGKTLYCFC